MTKSDVKKKKVLEIANRLFQEKGYVETTMTEIANESGISRRTLFRMFPSKDDLLTLHYTDLSIKDWFDKEPDDIDLVSLLNKFLKEQITTGGDSLHQDYQNWFKTLNSEPETRSAILQQVLKGMPVVVDLLTKRYPKMDKQEIWVTVGSLVGTTIAAWSQVSVDDSVDPLKQIDDNFQLLSKKLS